MERDMKDVSNGAKQKSHVLASCLTEMEKLFKLVAERRDKMMQFLSTGLKDETDALLADDFQASFNQPFPKLPAEAFE